MESSLGIFLGISMLVISSSGLLVAVRMTKLLPVGNHTKMSGSG